MQTEMRIAHERCRILEERDEVRQRDEPIRVLQHFARHRNLRQQPGRRMARQLHAIGHMPQELRRDGGLCHPPKLAGTAARTSRAKAVHLVSSADT